MIIDNASLNDLLALANEIARTERLPVKQALRAAVKLWPSLQLDARQSAGMPTGKERKRHRTQVRRNARAA